MIEMGKQYRTRDGREVRIYAVDGLREEEVHGSIRQTIGTQIGWLPPTTWDKNGSWSCVETENDLIEVKPQTTRTYWLVHYPDNIVIHEQLYKPKIALSTALAITGPHEVTFTEGEGL